MEGKGPFGKSFDYVMEDTLFGEKSWEKAESKMLRESILRAIMKAKLTPADIDFMFAGDLLNQIVAANFAAREINIPFLGLYGACSTMVEGLALAAMMIDGGFAHRTVVGASSHHNSAERQYRMPTEQGTQRVLWAQWTVTGAGSALLVKEGTGPVLTHCTLGQVQDLGMKDANDMGSCMAPAAADTLIRHFQDLGRQPTDYDLILSGDLGSVGLNITKELLGFEGYDVKEKMTDSGVEIYSPEQDAHAGGSGCGCIATLLCGPILRRMAEGVYQRILVVGTGALLSPLSAQQGESVPAIAHAAVIEARP
jgi:stage V sporulation protein AD